MATRASLRNGRRSNRRGMTVQWQASAATLREIVFIQLDNLRGTAPSAVRFLKVVWVAGIIVVTMS